jgi:hypothetical protein
MPDDDAFYSPNHARTIAPRQAKPGEPVWSLQKNGHRVDCELRFYGESYGWECQCSYDGGMRYGQRFAVHEQALEEAECQRQRLMKEGWSA